MKISVVIPVYNTSKYLIQCIESVINQTYTNFEIICVDDGSVDDSLTVLNYLENKYQQVKVISQVNSGVTVARKVGVSCAVGDVIMFVDSDDTLPYYAMQTLARNMKDGVDIVVGNVVDVFNDEQVATNYTIGEFSGVDYANMIISDEMRGSPCSRLYRRSIFDDDCFAFSRDISYKEDVLMNLVLSKKCRKAVVIDDIVYTYFIHSDSTVRTFAKTVDYEINFYNLVCSLVDSTQGLKDATSNNILVITKINKFNRNECKKAVEFINTLHNVKFNDYKKLLAFFIMKLLCR